MRKKIVVLIVALVLLLTAVAPTLAAPPAFGTLYYNGGTVRTIVPAAPLNEPGSDDFYVVTNGDVAQQFGIAAVAPGDPGYNGGKWAVHTVTWNNSADAILLTSAAAVQAAADAGLVTIERVVEADFKCPIQP